jgi:hypothetical protein
MKVDADVSVDVNVVIVVVINVGQKLTQLGGVGQSR